MQWKTQRAVVIRECGKKPELKKDYPKPILKEGELLIQVHASTINPVDRLFFEGWLSKKPLPALCGMEGSGKVVEAKGEGLQKWVGKRVSFTSPSGSWCEFAVSNPLSVFEIDEDVPLSSASSGVVNPLAALGLFETFKQSGCKGIIMTAGASSLGKMLLRLCLKQNIPLLSIVRGQEEREQLKKEGAQHVLVTQGPWEKQLKNLVEKFDCNCVFDALGGGPVTESILSRLQPSGRYHLISTLEKMPLRYPLILYSGVEITGFSVFNWWAQTDESKKKQIRSQYSSLLKNELRTITSEQFPLENIDQAIQASIVKATQGKVLLKIM